MVSESGRAESRCHQEDELGNGLGRVILASPRGRPRNSWRPSLLTTRGSSPAGQGGGSSVAGCKDRAEPKESQAPETIKVQGVCRGRRHPQPFPSWSRGLVQTVNVQRAVLGGPDEVRRAKRRDEPREAKSGTRGRLMGSVRWGGRYLPKAGLSRRDTSPSPSGCIFPFPTDLGLPRAAEQERWGGPRWGCSLWQTAGLCAPES